MIDRFRSLPVQRTSYLVGHYIAELSGMVLATVLILIAGFVVGWRTHAGPVDLAIAAVLLLVFAAAMIWVGTWVGLLVRTPDAVMGVAFTMIFPLTFISNAFVPIESLPNVLQWVASVNPVSVIVAAVRDAVRQPGDAQPEGRVAARPPRAGRLPVHRGHPRRRHRRLDPPVPPAHDGLSERSSSATRDQ